MQVMFKESKEAVTKSSLRSKSKQNTLKERKDPKSAKVMIKENASSFKNVVQHITACKELLPNFPLKLILSARNLQN